MRALIAVAALMAAAAATAFAAEPPKPAAGTPAAAAPAAAAPAIAYVSPCAHPSMEPYPVIPDAATAKNSDIARANKAMNTWEARMNVFRECATKELNGVVSEIKAKQAANTAFGSQLPQFNASVDAFNKAMDAYGKTGLPLPQVKAKPPRPGDPCPPTPGSDPAPVSTLDLTKASKAEIKAAVDAFGVWAGPRQIYLSCKTPQMKTMKDQEDAMLAPLRAKQDAIIADYDLVNVPRKAFEARWDAFGKAYDARMKAAAGR